MNSLRDRRRAVPASLDMKNTKQCYPPRAIAVAQRPVSDATDFYDTEFEMSDSEDEDEDESPRMSMDSFGYDSNSSLSTADPPTPDNLSERAYDPKDDSLVRGPSGPHLFRASLSSAGSAPTTEVDLYFERSPVNSQFPSTSTASQFPSSTASGFPSSMASGFPSSTASKFPLTTASGMPSSTISQFPSTATGSQFTETPSRLTFSQYGPKPSTMHPDVSHVEEEEIRNWTPSQVAYWLYIAGYDDSTIEKFIINDITGTVLLSLQIDDLKELDIMSFGKRRQLINSIDHLRNTMRKTTHQQQEGSDHDYSSSPRSSKGRSYRASVSPAGEILSPARYEDGDKVTPGELVSIVGIEQLLPKPHSCSKGEDCPKYQRRQRQIEKIMAENPGAVVLPGGMMLTGNPGNPETAQNMLRPQSDAQPSVVASSDVFGPAQEAPQLSEEALSEVEKDDPRERMRKFLHFQHVSSPDKPSPEPLEEPEQQQPLPPMQDQTALSSMPPVEPASSLSPPNFRIPHVAANLRNLPKLTIPADSDSDELTTATATALRTITPGMVNVYGSPTATQEYGPFSTYRQGTPFSEMDVPVTAIPNGPVARETSQSVPPDMRYGDLLLQASQDPVMRSASTRPKMAPPLRRVHEGRPLTPIEAPSDLDHTPRLQSQAATSSANPVLASDPDVTRSGWMKKRKTTRILRHEWQDAHFTLRGTNLAMHKEEANAHRNSRALDNIDVDDYAVACSSLATSSKLTAAFKKSILRSGNQPGSDQAAFAFSLVPTPKEAEKKTLFHNNLPKSHHFAVKNREDRIDWMRELMLAKALKKGRDGGSEMQVNGNFI